MNKVELISRVYKDTKFRRLPKIAVEEMILSVFDIISEGVATHGKFNFPGFGTFLLRTRKARKGRNPSTGAEMWIAGQKTMTFRVSPKLKDSLK